MRKPDTLDGRNVNGQWWKHLKYYKRIVHKAERANCRVVLQSLRHSVDGRTGA